MPVFTFTAGSLGDLLATAGLAAQVIKVLYDHRNLSEECDDLAIELQSLQQVLILTELAMERYETTPLGGPLAHCIRPEVAQCHLSLKKFAQTLVDWQNAVKFTTISALWRRIMWAASDEANALAAKLSNHRLKLTTLLISLHSIGLLEASPSRLGTARSHLQKGSLSMTRIKDNTIQVIDLLGDTIPISTLFCSSWESFHHILKGYSSNRMGQEFVERGDFEIVRADSGWMIFPEDFARVVQEGDVLEMSAVFRLPATARRKAFSCPRCSRASISNLISCTWIRCAYCSCCFNVGLRYATGTNQTDVSGISNELPKSPKGGQHSCQESDMMDATYFRRITLEFEQTITFQMTLPLVSNQPFKPDLPVNPASRKALQQTLDLARKAVQLDTENKLVGALEAYTGSAVLLTGVLEKCLPLKTNKKNREQEMARVTKIRNTYVSRMNAIVKSGVRLRLGEGQSGRANVSPQAI